MMKRLITTALNASLLTASLCWASGVNAALLLKGELTHEYQVQTGQTVQGVLEIYNGGDQATEIKLTQDNSAPNGDHQNHARSNRAWVHLSQDRLLLPPHTTQKVPYTVAVPNGVPTGTYWSLLGVEPLLGESAESQMINPPGKVVFGVKQKIRYEINVMTHLGAGQSKITFSHPKLTTDPRGGKQLQVMLANEGNRHARPTLSLEVFDSRGQRIKTLTGAKRGLYPDANKPFTVPLVGLKPGRYKTLMVAQDANTGRIFGADLDLNIKP